MKEKLKINLLKKNNGITLIALVVTIIVLIILAGITINLILGENGLIKKALLAKEAQEKASASEDGILKDLEQQIIDQTGTTPGQGGNNGNGYTITYNLNGGFTEKVITWDGDITGKTKVVEIDEYDNSYEYYLISEEVPSLEGLDIWYSFIQKSEEWGDYEIPNYESKIQVSGNKIEIIDLNDYPILTIVSEADNVYPKVGIYFAYFGTSEYCFYYADKNSTAGNPTTYTADTPTFSLKNPNKMGYTFLGWTGSNGETPQTEVTIPTGSSGNKEYTAVFAVLDTVIPYGSQYIKADGTILESGEAFPDTLTTGDIYVYGDYTYAYNMSASNYTSPWYTKESLNGWGCRVRNTNKTSYESVLESLGGAPITCMGLTYWKCTELEDISGLKIPNTVIDMANTFQDCTNLRNISGLVIPNGVINMRYIFYNCSKLTDISGLVIPNTITDMEGAFYGCSGITDISGLVISNGVTSIDLSGCSGITDISGLVIPNSVTSISLGGWSGITDISGLVIPNSVTSISLGGCTGLTDISGLVIPNSVTEISFYGCSGLTDISGLVIPNSVTSMNLSRCTGLTSVTLPDSLTSISARSLEGCTGLTTITIPVSVTTIESNAFNGCTALKNVIYKGTQEQWNTLKSNIETTGNKDTLLKATVTCAGE